MFVSNALIGLREGLEAALVVVILLAFLRKTGRTWAFRWVGIGVAAAVGLSVLLGAILTFGTRELDDEVQEIIGGVTSIIAVAFVTVMVLWMRTAARTISGELTGKLNRALDLGPLAIAAVGFLGVGREGLETAIFFYATAEAAGGGQTAPLLGWAVGLLAAVVLGYLIYRGALRLNLTRFFRWTGIALIIVAAGILAYGIHDLQEAGVLPGEHALAFDVSSVIVPGTAVATLLRGIFNFTPETSWLQAIAWVLYVGIVLPVFLRPLPASPTAPSAKAASAQAAGEPAEPTPTL